MDFEKYKNRMTWPERPREPKRPDGTAADHRRYADDLEAYGRAMTKWREERSAYNAEDGRLHELFKHDCLAEAGLTNHPKASDLFEKCWAYMHSSGMHDVWSMFDEFSDVLQDTYSE